MKHQMVILRLIFGLTFIFSGFVKMIDPIGTALVIHEYLNAAHLQFFSFMEVHSGIALSIMEFLVGVAILMRMRMKEASWVGLVMTVFFTIVTLLLLIFDPIQDCGCFGQAASLSHEESFIKNIVLLLCIVPIFFKRKEFRRDSSPFVEWLFLSTYGVIALVFSIVSYVRMPVVEYGDFKTGTDIAVKLIEAQQTKSYETLFVYEKDGKKREFGLEELPDTTWTFVEAVDVSESEDEAPFDFYVTNEYGEYITDTLITTEIPILMCSIYDLEEYYTPERWAYLTMLKENVENIGGELWVLVASTPDRVRELLGEDVASAFEFGYTDYKTAISVHRSNGGYLYINSAFIVRKWPRQGIIDISVMESDHDVIMMHNIIKQQLIHQISIVVLLASIAIIRYFCKVIAMRRLRKVRAENSSDSL
jgi:uncharacterized membrane protein YphA (DoxX/SURF4 family)